MANRDFTRTAGQRTVIPSSHRARSEGEPVVSERPGARIKKADTTYP